MDKMTGSQFKQNVAWFRENLPRIQKFREITRDMVKLICEEVSGDIRVEAVIKTVASFADEISRSALQITQPADQISDLVAIDVIVPNIYEQEHVTERLRQNFHIIEECRREESPTFDPEFLNETPCSLVVQTPEASDLYERLGVSVTPEIKSLKATLRVQTILRNCWMVNLRDRFLREGFKLPLPFRRNLNQITTLLDTADELLVDLMARLEDYRSSYGAYLSYQEIVAEMSRLEDIFHQDPADFDSVEKLAKMTMTVELWPKAQEVLEKYLASINPKKIPNSKLAAIFRDLGIVVCKINDPEKPEFSKGQDFLQKAVSLNPQDPDALAALGGTFKTVGESQKAHECYRKALDESPGDPYALGNFLIFEILEQGKLDPVKNYHEMIQTAIRKRKAQIEVRVDLPWAFFDVGIFSLLLGDLHESLKNFLLALRYSPQPWMVETTLGTLRRLAPVFTNSKGMLCVEILLHLGIVALLHARGKSGEEDYQKAISALVPLTGQSHPLDESLVLIIAGSTDHAHENEIKTYHDIFLDAFSNYAGIIISGGTQDGVGSLVGDIQEKYPEIVTIGYVPEKFSPDVKIDDRYREIRRTKGSDFSFLEALHYWTDILAAGIDPRNIKIIGVGGGKISALEYRLALLLGAQVALIGSSSRATRELITDPLWKLAFSEGKTERIIDPFKILDGTFESIQDFLTQPFIVDPDIENLSRILIRDPSGRDIFDIGFDESDIEEDLLAGLMTALDYMGSELKLGQIISTKFKKGYLTGGFLKDYPFKVVFFLHHAPSETLDTKILKYINQVESKFGEHFLDIQKRCRVYHLDDAMREIFVDVFGQEISKLL